MSSSKAPLPKNWPLNVTYVTASTLSKTLSSSHITSLRTRLPKSQDLLPNTPTGPSPFVKILPITSPKHPANGQFGLFATRDLKAGSFILQYVGEIHATPSQPQQNPQDSLETVKVTRTAADPHANSDYDLSLDREHAIGIDADKKGNEARFINDYRGAAERPNAEFREFWDGRKGLRGMGVWVLEEGRSGKGKGKGKVKSGIKKGEEILVSYGRGFWGARERAKDEL